MSDDDMGYDAKAHKQLLQSISSLGKSQHIRKSTRTEVYREQNEFQLVKNAKTSVVDFGSGRPTTNAVGIRDILRVLKSNKKHLDTGKKLKNLQNRKRVLEEPLEKPIVDSIKRAIGFEKAKNQLERWNAVVAKNRAADALVFPLQSETVYVNTSAHAAPIQTSLKSALALELEATDKKLRTLKRARMGDTKDEKVLEQCEKEQLQKMLTRDELIARRRELAYLKMRESQKSAKARQRNKIKSKKYHKLVKRQKMLEQMKEFEMLKKTNPEAALEKLNELEKSRVIERASLRHRNTGVWAKNLKVRAKYDKDVRKELEEQLALSRQLTEKKLTEDDDGAGTVASDVEQEFEKGFEQVYDPFNPWTKMQIKVADEGEIKEDETNWRKYWLERNENEKLIEEYCRDENAKKTVEMPESEKENKMLEEEAKIETSKKYENKTVKGKQGMVEATKKLSMEAMKKLKSKAETKKKQSLEKNREFNGDYKHIKEKAMQTVQSSKKFKKTPDQVTVDTTQSTEPGWVVTKTKSTLSIDDIFDAQEDKIRHKMNTKLKKLEAKAKRLQKQIRPVRKSKIIDKKNDELKNLKDLTFKEQANRPDIDEELINHMEQSESTVQTSVNSTNNKLIKGETIQTESNNNNSTLDTNNIIELKLNQDLNCFNVINENLGELNIDEEEQDRHNEEQLLTISEAFEDDDIIADFSREKRDDGKLKNAEINLTMPGWGSWAGPGIKQKRNKNKRFILKLAPEQKRRDENKEGVYINEKISKQLRSHLVSDVPFPFIKLQDFEASIRAPLGRNTMPETAFRLLTRPKVRTLKGKIIEPMDENELIKRLRPLRHEIDKRIQRAAKERRLKKSSPK